MPLPLAKTSSRPDKSSSKIGRTLRRKQSDAAPATQAPRSSPRTNVSGESSRRPRQLRRVDNTGNTREQTPSSSSHAGPSSPSTDPSSTLANLFDALATASVANATSTPAPSVDVPTIQIDPPSRIAGAGPESTFLVQKLRSLLPIALIPNTWHIPSSSSPSLPASPPPHSTFILLLTRPRPARPSTSLPPPTRPPAHTPPPTPLLGPAPLPPCPSSRTPGNSSAFAARYACAARYAKNCAQPRVSRSAAHANPAGYLAHLQIGDTGAFDVRLAGAALYLRRGALPRFVLANDDSSLLSPTTLLATALAKYHVPRFLRPHLKTQIQTPSQIPGVRARPPTLQSSGRCLCVHVRAEFSARPCPRTDSCERAISAPVSAEAASAPPPPSPALANVRVPRAGGAFDDTGPANPKVRAVRAPPHVDASALPPKSFCELSSPCPHAFRLAERVRGRYAQRPPRRPPQSHIDPPRKSLRPHPRRQPSPSISAPSPALAARLKALSRTLRAVGAASKTVGANARPVRALRQIRRVRLAPARWREFRSCPAKSTARQIPRNRARSCRRVRVARRWISTLVDLPNTGVRALRPCPSRARMRSALKAGAAVVRVPARRGAQSRSALETSGGRDAGDVVTKSNRRDWSLEVGAVEQRRNFCFQVAHQAADLLGSNECRISFRGSLVGRTSARRRFLSSHSSTMSRSSHETHWRGDLEVETFALRTTHPGRKTNLRRSFPRERSPRLRLLVAQGMSARAPQPPQIEEELFNDFPPGFPTISDVFDDQFEAEMRNIYAV
ncbi:hypothetical protein B0H17DRAFT_1134544 [Mycena rosella]|uniref:Uncharacterized protein n=1 Tax=Mycena rosella TaxID=1033263 RepID=A0AAD7DGZ4_MYCRO|nr:hypothetical protein B0H17DRAFT_1134544 [Mycena rosella]